MKTSKILILTTIGVMLFFCAAAQSDCKSNNKERVNNNMNVNMNKTILEKMPDEEVSQSNQMQLKTLNEGTNSNIETPFIFVARSAETYALLQSFATNLPIKSRYNFGESAIVAAFAGTKNTGGYSVEIKKSAGQISVELNEPPKDAMTTQALTMPYKIVVIPIKAEDDLVLDIAENWQKAARTFQVISGEFEYSGGITGRGKKFTAEGTINILSFGDYATLIFNLSGKDTEKARKLNSAASGTFKNGIINVSSLDAGSFSENPKPPVKVSGRLANNKLELNFESLPSNVADGFQVNGKIEADKIK